MQRGSIQFLLFTDMLQQELEAAKSQQQSLGRTVGRVVKALDSQPWDCGYESLPYESLGKICTTWNVLRFTQP